MELSRYVFHTKDKAGDDVLFNTVTKMTLPVAAAEETLRRNHFLTGSEEEAVRYRLLGPTKQCTFNIIPTWECNLRCTHCTVLHKLLRTDPENIDARRTASFIRRFCEHHAAEGLTLGFVGGEPLLRAASITTLINTLVDMRPTCIMTTNLTVELTPTILDCLRRFAFITVSVDGLWDEHNTQRKSLTGEINPFLKTITNLKTLIKSGFQSKLTVQGALRDEFHTDDKHQDYLTFFLKLGIRADYIKFACVHPTGHTPKPSQSFLKSLRKSQVSTTMCCKYRYFNLSIDRNRVCSDFYSWEPLGTIDDTPETIMTRYHTAVLDSMPALNDPKCRSCPVLGCCWGGCTNAHGLAQRPSDFCDQAGLIAETQRLAGENKLIEALR